MYIFDLNIFSSLVPNFRIFSCCPPGMFHCSLVFINCPQTVPSVVHGGRRNGHWGWKDHLTGWKARRLEFMESPLRRIFKQTTSTGSELYAILIWKASVSIGLLSETSWTWKLYMEGKNTTHHCFFLAPKRMKILTPMLANCSPQVSEQKNSSYYTLWHDSWHPLPDAGSQRLCGTWMYG